jgi:hypothetical protein
LSLRIDPCEHTSPTFLVGGHGVIDMGFVAQSA